MKDFLSQTIDSAIATIKSDIHLASIDRDDIKMMIDSTIKRLNVFIVSYDTITVEKKLIQLVLVDNFDKLQDRKRPELLVHRKYQDTIKSYSMGSKAMGEERKDLLFSGVVAAKEMIDVLKDISKNLNKLIDSEVINKNIRISHVAVLGILKKADIMATWLLCWLGMISEVCINSKNYQVFKYRSKFLLDNVEAVAILVSQLIAKIGPYTFLSEVKKLKDKQIDMVLDKTPNDAFGVNYLTGSSSTHMSFWDNVVTALRVLNVFKAKKVRKDLAIHQKYKEDQEMCEWIEQRIKVLSEDMRGLDPNDPEYKRLEKIAEAYSERLAKLNELVTAYEEGEDVY